MSWNTFADTIFDAERRGREQVLAAMRHVLTQGDIDEIESRLRNVTAVETDVENGLASHQGRAHSGMGAQRSTSVSTVATRAQTPPTSGERSVSRS